MNELITEVKSGNQLAVKQLIDKYNESVRYITLQFTKDDSDLLQLIWINAIFKIGKFQSGDFKNWLQRLAKNVCIDNYRTNKCKNIFELYAELPETEDEEYDTLPDERIELIYDNLKILSDNEINVLVLRLNYLKYIDIANVLNIPKNTCLSHYRKAINKLKKHLHESIQRYNCKKTC